MKKVVDLSVKRRVTVAMFTLGVLLFGFVSFGRLKINLLPDLSYPTLTIRTEIEGAAPAEVENLITKPIEEVVGVVKNVVRVSSISRSGQSDVMIEFSWGTRMDYAVMEVKERLDSLELPPDTKRPLILRFDPTLDPIIRFYLYIESDHAAEAEAEEKLKFLRRFADEQIKKGLESTPGIAAVKVSGGLEEEIQVFVDQTKLAQLRIPIERIAHILRVENVNLSGGHLKEGAYRFLVRAINQFQSLEEIESVTVATTEGIPIYLRDIATVRRGYKERKAVTRLNGKEAVEIAVYKEGDANTVSAAREVDKKLGGLKSILPADLKIAKVYDQSIFIQQAVNEVINAGVVGGLLAVIILYFFLRNFWATVIISFSIPVSVITTFNLMYGADLSLNIMSLGGIALGIGMLLDNSIVVLENISRHREKGKDVLTAARDGAAEVSNAVTASTLTTVAVFFPLVFVRGIAGQLFRDQALTITFSLLISLVVALTLIPMLASLMKKTAGMSGPQPPPSSSASGSKNWLGRLRSLIFVALPVKILKSIVGVVRLFSKLLLFMLTPALKLFARGYASVENRYPVFLKKALNNRAIVMVVALAFFLVALLLIPSLGVELIPQLSQGEFRVEFRLPPGMPLMETDGIMKSVQKSMAEIGDIRATFSIAGTGNRFDANPEQGGENWGELAVVLPKGAGRADEERVMAGLRKNIELLPGVEYKLYRPTLFTYKTPIEIEVVGFDLKELKRVGNRIAGRLAASKRFTDVKSSLEVGQPEIQIRFDRERAASLGLNVYDIADRVVKKVRGEVATHYSWHDRKIDVLVRSREQDRTSIEDIGGLIVNPQSEGPVTLRSVADIVVGIGPEEIRRVDQERLVQITTNLNYGDLGAAAADITQIIKDIHIPADFSFRISGQNREMAVSFRSLQLALLLAIFLVYLVMASQFESLLHPLVIIFSIPLAIIGAVFALLITGSKISIVVFIGAILLAGIVVNNAIVLIDRINQMRSEGLPKMDAIMEAGRSRLRPILMTMLTTALGLLPLAIGVGEGAEIRAPMAITVIGGLMVSTLLTLIVIPVIYSLLDRKQ